MAKMDKKYCRGCRDNFYNGNNDLGVKECWMLADAKRENRLLIPIDQRPPYTQPPQLLPTCYHAKGYVTVKPEALDSKGFWKR
jgi:hypothetical protein